MEQQNIKKTQILYQKTIHRENYWITFIHSCICSIEVITRLENQVKFLRHDEI